MKMKRLLSSILCLCLLTGMLSVSAMAAGSTVTLREDWRLTSDLDLTVPEGETLTIDGQGKFYIYELPGQLLNSGLGVVKFKDTILYPATSTNLTSDQLMLERQPHAIAISDSIANGSITVDGSLTQAKKGDSVTLTVSPASGYELDALTVTASEGDDAGSVAVNESGTSYSFTMPAGDVDITASFKPTGTTSVTVNMDGVTLNDKTYDGTAITYSGAASAGGYSGDFTYEWYDEGDNKLTEAPKNAGTYTLRATVSDTTNYFGFAEKTVTINKATITVAAKNQSIYVGGTTPDLSAPVLNTHYTVTGLAIGDALGGMITMSYGSTPNTSTTGNYTIVISGAENPAGGNYGNIIFTNGTLTINAQPYTPPSSSDDNDYTPSTPATESVTVPISGDDNSINVGASVKGDTATIDKVDLSKLDTVISDHVDTGTVTIDFSNLDSRKPITTVKLPSNVIKEIAEAVSDPNNDAESLEIVLSDGTSIKFDAEALGEKAAQADGLDITISIKGHEDAKLTNAQKNTIGSRPAFDINVTSGGKHISDMGGKITVHAPYELKPGEKGRGIVVWYVDDHGNRERCETSYDTAKQRVNWKTDHLSLYMIDYDENAANPFVDVSHDAYYFNSVLWAVDMGITNGTSVNAFSPDVSCTRAQMATFLWRAAGSPDPAGSVNPFADVPADTYYTKAVQWAYEQGITGGTSATTFSPDATCTRGQMATFLWRNADSPATEDGTSPFSDVAADAYYAKAVQWAYGQKITGGTSATTFSPDDPCTRAQMVTFLYRFLAE